MNEKLSKRVVVENKINSLVSINSPQLGVKITWDKKDTKREIDRDKLERIFFEPGVEYMFTTGILYTDDMPFKQEVGLEPYDAKEPENIIVLNDAQRTRYLKVMPIGEFKTSVDKLPKEQVLELANYAVLNQLGDLDKWKYLTDKSEINILNAIRNLQDSITEV